MFGPHPWIFLPKVLLQVHTCKHEALSILALEKGHARVDCGTHLGLPLDASSLLLPHVLKKLDKFMVSTS